MGGKLGSNLLVLTEALRHRGIPLMRRGNGTHCVNISEHRVPGRHVPVKVRYVKRPEDFREWQAVKDATNKALGKYTSFVTMDAYPRLIIDTSTSATFGVRLTPIMAVLPEEKTGYSRRAPNAE